MHDFVVVEILDALEELLENALELGKSEEVLLAVEAGKIVVHVVEDEEGGACFRRSVPLKLLRWEALLTMISLRRMMFLWFMILRSLISRMAVMGKPRRSGMGTLGHDFGIAGVNLFEGDVIVGFEALGLVDLAVGARADFGADLVIFIDIFSSTGYLHYNNY